MTIGNLIFIIFFMVLLIMDIRGGYIFVKGDSTKDTGFDLLCVIFFIISILVLVVGCIMAFVQYVMIPLVPIIEKVLDYKIF